MIRYNKALDENEKAFVEMLWDEYKVLDENEKAFVETLWDEYKALMYLTALKYSRDSHQVQDIIQNSVEKIIKKVSVLISLDRCALTSYIVLIVRSTSLNYLKRARIELRLFC